MHYVCTYVYIHAIIIIKYNLKINFTLFLLSAVRVQGEGKKYIFIHKRDTLDIDILELDCLRFQMSHMRIKLHIFCRDLRFYIP